MISLISPNKAQIKLAEELKDLRLDQGFTQKGLSERSGVSLATLRKFEQIGKISLESFIKLCITLGCIENLLEAVKTPHIEFKSIDDVLDDSSSKKRQRGWRE